MARPLSMTLVLPSFAKPADNVLFYICSLDPHADCDIFPDLGGPEFQIPVQIQDTDCWSGCEFLDEMVWFWSCVFPGGGKLP